MMQSKLFLYNSALCVVLMIDNFKTNFVFLTVHKFHQPMKFMYCDTASEDMNECTI